MLNRSIGHDFFDRPSLSRKSQRHRASLHNKTLDIEARIIDAKTDTHTDNLSVHLVTVQSKQISVGAKPARTCAARHSPGAEIAYTTLNLHYVPIITTWRCTTQIQAVPPPKYTSSSHCHFVTPRPKLDYSHSINRQLVPPIQRKLWPIPRRLLSYSST